MQWITKFYTIKWEHFWGGSKCIKITILSLLLNSVNIWTHLIYVRVYKTNNIYFSVTLSAYLHVFHLFVSSFLRPLFTFLLF